MIRRTYFMSASALDDEGGLLWCGAMTLTFASWFPRSERALEKGKMRLCDECAAKGVIPKNFHVAAFNRI